MDLYTDGAARGNPGPAGGGIVLKDRTRTIEERPIFFGRKTNNEAEYLALIEGLKLALQHNAKHLRVYMDSQLIVRQMLGQYRIKSRRLLPLWKQARELASKFEFIEFFHIKRGFNSLADRLANQAIDNAETS